MRAELGIHGERCLLVEQPAALSRRRLADARLSHIAIAAEATDISSFKPGMVQRRSSWMRAELGSPTAANNRLLYESGADVALIFLRAAFI